MYFSCSFTTVRYDLTEYSTTPSQCNLPVQIFLYLFFSCFLCVYAYSVTFTLCRLVTLSVIHYGILYGLRCGSLLHEV